MHNNTPQILFADDSEVGRKIFAATLTRLGFVVDTAENGIVVLQKCQQTFYRVLIMDINMPELDGIQTAQRVRDNCTPDNQPVMIAVSGNTTAADCAYYLANGFDHFVPKPIDMPALAELLQSILT